MGSAPSRQIKREREKREGEDQKKEIVTNTSITPSTDNNTVEVFKEEEVI
jgi:hypothetical protein